MSTVLKVNDITMQFGGVVAVNNLSMRVDEGEIVALIGPNGAGKTTAFNCITGVYEPTNGEVWFHDKLIASNRPSGKMKKLYAGENRGKYTHVVVNTPDKITRMGIARTFQNIRLFKTQTVFENVLIATHLRKKSNLFTATFHLNGREERAMREECMELLKIVGLADVAGEMATSLPYGKQRRLEIARALATKPSLLLLDEPAAGMNPQETDELGDFIRAHQGALPAHRVHDRASHESGHGHLRPHLRDRLWPAHRRRHARRGAGRSRGHTGISGGG